MAVATRQRLRSYTPKGFDVSTGSFGARLNKGFVGFSKSLSCYFRRSSNPTAQETLVSLGSDASDIPLQRLHFNTSGGTLAFQVRAANGAAINCSGGPDFADGKWHQAVGIAYEGISGVSSSQAWLYVDGVLQATATGTSFTTTNFTNLTVGYLDRTTSGFDFAGEVALPAMWDRKLSASEVERLWQYGHPKAVPEGLSHLLDFSGGRPSLDEVSNDRWTWGSTAHETKAATRTGVSRSVSYPVGRIFYSYAAAGGGESIALTAASMTLTGQSIAVLMDEALGVTRAQMAMAGQAIKASEAPDVSAAAMTIAPQPVLASESANITAASAGYTAQATNVKADEAVGVAAAAMTYVGKALNVLAAELVAIDAATMNLRGKAISLGGEVGNAGRSLLRLWQRFI